MPADVQKIKTQHANFHAQPKPQQVPAVTFSQSRQISGSEQWQGQKYTVFRSYRPARHDQGWYRSRYTRIELIGGGYYFFNAGYWYPAWGYQPSAEYYVYDGPIYAGREAEPPDRVIADVQASLQEIDQRCDRTFEPHPPSRLHQVLAAHAAIGLGTLAGGWRIIHTMGSRITRLRPVSGFCAETGGAITLFLATALGIPVSTTHTITGAIVGVGSVQNASAVRWGVAGRIVWAWVLTIPCTAFLSALTWAAFH